MPHTPTQIAREKQRKRDILGKQLQEKEKAREQVKIDAEAARVERGKQLDLEILNKQIAQGLKPATSTPNPLGTAVSTGTTTPDITPTTTKPTLTPLQIAQKEIAKLTQETERLSDKRAAEQKAADIKRGTRGIAVGETTTPDTTVLPDITGLPSLQKQELGLLQTLGQKQLGLSTQETASQIKEKQAQGRTEALLGLRDTQIGDVTARTAIQNQEEALGRKMTNNEIADFIAQNGIDVGKSVLRRINREKTFALDNQQEEEDFIVSQNAIFERRLERNLGRSVRDREKFNIQQDARLRRMANIFGAANVSTANAAILDAQEEGQTALEDLRADFQDRFDSNALRVAKNIKTIDRNKQIIQSQASELIEDKYIDLQETIEGLWESGVTDAEEINRLTIDLQKEYFNLYDTVNTRALGLLQEQNQAVANARTEADKVVTANEKVFNLGIAKIRTELQKAGVPITESFQNVLLEGLDRIDAGENPQAVLNDVVRAVQNNPKFDESLRAKFNKAIASSIRTQQLVRRRTPSPTSPQETQAPSNKDLTVEDVENMSIEEILKLAK